MLGLSCRYENNFFSRWSQDISSNSNVSARMVGSSITERIHPLLLRKFRPKHNFLNSGWWRYAGFRNKKIKAFHGRHFRLSRAIAWKYPLCLSRSFTNIRGSTHICVLSEPSPKHWWNFHSVRSCSGAALPQMTMYLKRHSVRAVQSQQQAFFSNGKSDHPGELYNSAIAYFTCVTGIDFVFLNAFVTSSNVLCSHWKHCFILTRLSSRM